jgi:ABC-type enterobactin transport system permease subunit
MNPKLVLAAIAIVAAFSIAAATVDFTTIATPALAQNMTAGDNMNMGAAGNMTAGNMTGNS